MPTRREQGWYSKTLVRDAIMEVLADHCTGQDDHDGDDCNKCSQMEEELFDAVVKALEYKG